MGKSVLLEILNSPDTKKGAAHRAAPLVDSPTSCPKSTESKKHVHLAALKVLPDIIGKSIESEIHPDYHKGDDDKRHIENGHGDDILVHRFYGACDIEGNLYRVKTTMLEFRDETRTNRPHSYEVTKIELLDGLSNSPRREMVGSNPSISAAKLLNNVETTKDKEKKTLDYLSISAPIAEARDNQEFISAAKLQQNFETTKDKEQKKHCHRRTTEHEPNRVANSSSR